MGRCFNITDPPFMGGEDIFEVSFTELDEYRKKQERKMVKKALIAQLAIVGVFVALIPIFIWIFAYFHLGGS